jgi:hypothetical protein
LRRREALAEKGDDAVEGVFRRVTRLVDELLGEH